LDPTQIVEIRNLIKHLAKNATVMLSTHILSEAEATCERAIIIIEGEIRADARIQDLSKTSEVILTIDGKKQSQSEDLEKELRKIPGIAQARPEPFHSWEHLSDRGGSFLRFRLQGEESGLSGHELASRIFSHAKKSDWNVCELRPEFRTLEAVFKGLASGGGSSSGGGGSVESASKEGVSHE